MSDLGLGGDRQPGEAGAVAVGELSCDSGLLAACLLPEAACGRSPNAELGAAEPGIPLREQRLFGAMAVGGRGLGEGDW